MNARAVFVASCGLFLAACGGSMTAPGDTLAAGVWGGVGIQMTVTPTRSTLDFGCDVGSIDGAVALNSSGGFLVSGFYAFGVGGPRQPTDPPLTPHATRYEGTTDGKTLRLSVFLTDLSRKIGDYELVLGRPASLDRCL